MDIRTKLMLALVSVSLLSIAAFGSLMYLMSVDLILQNSDRQLTAIAASKARELDNLLTSWQADARRLAQGEQLQIAVRTSADWSDPNAPDALLNTVVESNPDIRWISVYDAGGRRLATTEPDWPSQVVADERGGGVSIAGARQLPDTSVGIVLSMPLGEGDARGTIEVGFDTAAIGRITGDHTGLGETGESLLVAPSWVNAAGESVEGYLIINPPAGRTDPPMRSGPLAEAPDVVALALGGAEAALQQSDYFGTPVVASARTLEGPDWRLLVKVDSSEELAPVDELLYQLRGLGLSLSAFAIIGGVFFGNYLARSIRKLADTVDRIRHGEVELRAEVEGEDEVALLAQSLNEFMNQLDRSGDIFQLGELRVLLVEREAAVRHRLGELLTNWRMKAIVVADGREALEAIATAESDGDPIQLVLLDQNIPQADRARLLERLSARGESNRCPVILLVKEPDALDPEGLKRMGVVHVLPKPVVASDLMEAILEEMGVSTSAIGSVTDVLLTRVAPRKILLVEDSSIIRHVTVGFLENWGHTVTVARDGREAVETHRRQRFDLILMDLEMPEMNGIDATLAIRQQAGEGERRTPIVALTARATREDREECMAAGMDDYISKPVDPKVLYRLVNSYPAAILADADADADADGASPVDWQVARSLAGGNQELLNELVGLFPAESARYLNAIRAAAAAGDTRALAQSAHSLKGAAALFGAEALVARALEAENLGNASNIDAARQCLPALEAETARLNDALADGPAHGA